MLCYKIYVFFKGTFSCANNVKTIGDAWYVGLGLDCVDDIFRFFFINNAAGLARFFDRAKRWSLPEKWEVRVVDLQLLLCRCCRLFGVC